EPRIGNREGCGPLDRVVTRRQRLDARRINIMAATDDDVLLAADDSQIAALVHPTEVASHEPAIRIERGLGGRLIVEIAEHQAGAAGADLADFAGRRLRIRVVPAPDADLEPF